MTRFRANYVSIDASIFNDLKIHSSVVEISEAKGEDIEIYSEKTEIENSQFRMLSIFD